MIYKNIAEQLDIRINSSHYPVGSALPSEENLAVEFGVSRMTIRKAVNILVNAGLVTRRQGSGTYVSRKNVYQENSSVTGLTELAESKGKKIETKVISFEVIPAPRSIAEQLRVLQGESIFSSRRIRFVDNVPVVVEDSYMPVRLFRNLSILHLEHSKFNFIEKDCGMIIDGYTEGLTPVLSDKTISFLMNIPEHTPLLRITSVYYDNKGNYLNFSIMYRNTNKYQVEYKLKRNRP
ncbi:GntR family transcriptional regulator (plasmid) [Klebsiella michiganensis]|uniref:GntR family transcriptional regulator n=1 Tax=Klebsiella michiganensis TaxID=1134687 RepID=UPI0021DA9D47|nr:GntR family transcriptional regulator [Klebsiella michiganensis]UYB60130.1 GntR family transcriptional regulator [Klebsiella michiganensis]